LGELPSINISLHLDDNYSPLLVEREYIWLSAAWYDRPTTNREKRVLGKLHISPYELFNLLSYRSKPGLTSATCSRLPLTFRMYKLTLKR
jgi:hypothetical protein